MAEKTAHRRIAEALVEKLSEPAPQAAGVTAEIVPDSNAKPVTKVMVYEGSAVVRVTIEEIDEIW